MTAGPRQAFCRDIITRRMAPETWTNIALTVVLVGVTIYYAVTTRKMFLLQTNPSVRLSIEHINHGHQVENRLVVENFSPYAIIGLQLRSGNLQRSPSQ